MGMALDLMMIDRLRQQFYLRIRQCDRDRKILGSHRRCFLVPWVRIIESMMVLRQRQGNLRHVFGLFSHMRGFAEHTTNNLKTSLRCLCRGHNTVIGYFLKHDPFSSFPQQEMRQTFCSICPSIQKCNMQNSNFTMIVRKQKVYFCRPYN